MPELVLKWRVSAHALRKQITRNGSTKRDCGDEQALEQAAAREAMLEAARNESPEAREARLFDGIDDLDDDGAGDPVTLARVATRASGRAMIGRLWAEAKALAGLAESYARLAGRTGPSVDEPWGRDGPSEADFEAVRRKVLGLTVKDVEDIAARTGCVVVPD